MDAKDEFLVRFSCSRNDSNRCDAGLRLDKFALPACEHTGNSSALYAYNSTPFILAAAHTCHQYVDEWLSAGRWTFSICNQPPAPLSLLPQQDGKWIVLSSTQRLTPARWEMNSSLQAMGWRPNVAYRDGRMSAGYIVAPVAHWQWMAA